MPSIDLDTKHWIKVSPVEDEIVKVTAKGFACYWSRSATPPEKASEGTELAENSAVTVEEPNGRWFRAKEPSSTEAPVQPCILEVEQTPPLGGEEIGTAQLDKEAVTAAKIAKEAVTAPKLKGVFGLTPGVLDPGGERTPRSSITWPGAGVPLEVAAQVAEVGNWIAVPVQVGDVFKNVAVAGSKTAASTVAEYITAIYIGETGGALIAQSKSVTPGSHPKEEMYAVELESTVTITSTNAPKGYVYVLVSAGAAGTMFGFVGMTYTTANQAVLGIYGTAGVAANALYNSGGTLIKTKAPATVPTLTAVASVPIVTLY